MPDAWPAVRVFLASQTQWRLGPSGHFSGLDYRAACVAARGVGERWTDVFENLRIMEAEVLTAQGEKGG